MAEQPKSAPTNRLYIGNLSWSMDNNGLQQAFVSFNPVEAKVIFDRETGRSKGFGFVTFNDDASAQQALEALNGTEMGGRQIRIDFAQPQAPRAPREGGGFGGAPGGGRGFGAFGGQQREGGGGYNGGSRGGYGGGRGGGRGGYGGDRPAYGAGGGSGGGYRSDRYEGGGGAEGGRAGGDYQQGGGY